MPDISGEVDIAGEKTRDISGEIEAAGTTAEAVSGEAEAAGERGGHATGRGRLSLLTEPLGLFGWSELETVLLAAVASETPLLLVGSHGCAKSFFLERLATVLGLEYRFYNASLINYDDLVGIPMPSEDRKRLEYIATPSAIWDAEVVFLDEINRTKPELQNKLFPIIHERRVQGITLEKLRFRWAAMNPPLPDAEYDEVAYLGAEPLDTALADRFGFIVEVPSWDGLTQEDRMAVLHDRGHAPHPFSEPVDRVIALCRDRFNLLKRQPLTELCSYLVLLWNELVKVGVTLSTRRMVQLYENILAVHAAASTIRHFCGQEDRDDWSTSAFQALQHSLPQRAQGTVPESLRLSAAHLQAWALMNKNRGQREFALLTISDDVERACEALRYRDHLSPEAVGSALINFLAGGERPLETHARALALYAATHRRCTLPAAVLDAMANPLEGIFCPAAFPVDVPRHDRDYVSKLQEEVADTTGPRETVLCHYDKNLAKRVYEITRNVQECKEAVTEFRCMRKLFGRALAVNNKENRHG